MQMETLTFGQLLLFALTGPVTAGIVGGIFAMIVNRKTVLAQQERIAIQSLYDKTREAETRLARIRDPLYADLLEPWTLIWAGIKTGAKDQQKGMRLAISAKYISTLFAFNATASDQLVSTHNRLMENLFQLENMSDKEKVQSILHLGELLLAIRKDFGLEDTALTAKDMLRSRIHDIDSIM